MTAQNVKIGGLQLEAKNGCRYEFGLIVEGQNLKMAVSSTVGEARNVDQFPKGKPSSQDKPPVEEPPNAPKKAPIKEPPPEDPDREPPSKPPPTPHVPPIEEPPNAPNKPPVKEPPPRDPDREPPKPPIRAMSLPNRFGFC
jgi:hypothetical protein